MPQSSLFLQKLTKFLFIFIHLFISNGLQVEQMLQKRSKFSHNSSSRSPSRYSPCFRNNCSALIRFISINSFRLPFGDLPMNKPSFLISRKLNSPILIGSNPFTGWSLTVGVLFVQVKRDHFEDTVNHWNFSFGRDLPIFHKIRNQCGHVSYSLYLNRT